MYKNIFQFFYCNIFYCILLSMLLALPNTKNYMFCLYHNIFLQL